MSIKQLEVEAIMKNGNIYRLVIAVTLAFIALATAGVWVAFNVKDFSGNNSSPAAIDIIAGVYDELGLYYFASNEPEASFTPTESDDRMVYIFNLDGSFEFREVTNRFSFDERFEHIFEGTFEVEEITIDEIDADKRQLMPYIDIHANSGLYRVTLYFIDDFGPERYFESEMFMAYLNDSERIFYSPSTRSAMTVRQVLATDKVNFDTIEPVIGSYTEKGHYSGSTGEILTIDVDERMTFIFRSNMTFRVQHTLNRSTNFYEGVFEAERIEIDDVDISDWLDTPSFLKSDNTEWYRIFAYNLTGLESVPKLELFMLRSKTSDEVVLYVSVLDEFIMVRQIQ